MIDFDLSKITGREPPLQTEDEALANVMEMIAVMDKALRDIDDFSIGSSIQPVRIAREALRKLYGPNYRHSAGPKP